jgi:CubicO group peptidase (beta-lactamase class C family)
MAHIEGTVDPGFAAVREAFAHAQAGDPGAAQLAVWVRGRPVVDLWSAGDGRIPYDGDSIQVLYSVSKGLTATCAHLLRQRGLLDIDALVVRYWPGFAANGKATVTVRQLLTHTAGLSTFPPDAGIAQEGLFDWDRCVSALAGMAPIWEPGTAYAYHARTFGYLIGELVRRIDGRGIGRFFAEEIAAPLGLDLWIGLPEQQEHRVAPQLSTNEEPPLQETVSQMRALMAGHGIDTSLPVVQALLSGFHRLGDTVALLGTRAGHAAEIPAANAIGNACSLARLYAALIGEPGGSRRLDDATVIAATTPHTDHLSEPWPLSEMPAPTRLRYGLGYQLGDPMVPMPGPRSFGHAGIGGQLSYADPASGVAVGYTCTNLALNVPDPRWLPWTAALTETLNAVQPRT